MARQNLKSKLPSMIVMFQVNFVEKSDVIVLSNCGIHYPSTCCLLLIYLARLRSESC